MYKSCVFPRRYYYVKVCFLTPILRGSTRLKAVNHWMRVFGVLEGMQ